MSTAAYLNRRFDVLALHGALPVGKALLDRTLFSPAVGGEVCTGAQKLTQRWLLTFLTIRGSMTFAPERGTDFMLDVRRGGFRNEIDVILAFNIATVLVRQQLIAEEDATWHPEERYDKAELLRVILTGDTLAIYVRIWSLAGEAREIILPIATTPTKVGG